MDPIGALASAGQDSGEATLEVASLTVRTGQTSRNRGGGPSEQVLECGSRVEVVATPVLEVFMQWLLCTNTGLAAKICLDAGAALTKGAPGRTILASFLGI